MPKCLHISCSRDKRIWIHLDNQSSKEVKLHPWCINCGVVKNISDDKSRKLGHWVNVLSRISKSFSLKQVQKHRIVQELASHELFNDEYFISGNSQKALFIKIVKKYCHIKGNSLESFIY